MRIAICTDIYLPQLAGVADSISSLSAELMKRGHDVRIYAPHIRGDSFDPRVFRTSSIAVPGTQSSLLVAFPFGMLSDMRAWKPDIIHAHTFSGVGLCAWYASIRRKIPLVGTDHTFPADYLTYLKLDWLSFFGDILKHFAAWYYNQTVFVTTPSNVLMRELFDYGMRRPHQIISNPIDMELFRPLPDRAALKEKYGIQKPAIVFVGRLAVEKNVEFALNVFAETRRRMDIEFIVVGDGPYRKRMEDKVAYDAIPDVRFVGVLRGESLVEIMNASDIYLITSIIETQSMSTLQAMVSGLPVVAANAGALPEYVVDGKNGFLVSPEDAPGYADKLVFLGKDAELRNRLGASGRESVENYSSKHIADLFETIYKNAISATKAPVRRY